MSGGRDIVLVLILIESMACFGGWDGASVVSWVSKGSRGFEVVVCASLRGLREVAWGRFS